MENFGDLGIGKSMFDDTETKNERRKNCAQDNAGKKCRKTAYRKTVCRIMQERFNVLQFSRAGDPCTRRERYAA
jgi:hypothetical protein